MINKTLLYYTPLKVRRRTLISPHYTAFTFFRKVIYYTTTSPFRSTQQTDQRSWFRKSAAITL